MTYHFTYRVTFEGTRFYYYGLHSTKNLNDGYLGSPRTNRWCWDLYTPTLTPLEFFDTREDAAAVEHRLIKPSLNDPLCLNAHSNACWSLQASSLGAKAQPVEVKRENGKKLADYNRKHKTGGQSMPLEKKRRIARENNAKITLEQRRANAAKQHSQRWRCLKTGKVTTPGPLSRWQKKRGIDTSLRERLE